MPGCAGRNGAQGSRQSGPSLGLQAQGTHCTPVVTPCQHSYPAGQWLPASATVQCHCTVAQCHSTTHTLWWTGAWSGTRAQPGPNHCIGLLNFGKSMIHDAAALGCRYNQQDRRVSTVTGGIHTFPRKDVVCMHIWEGQSDAPNKSMYKAYVAMCDKEWAQRGDALVRRSCWNHIFLKSA